MLVLVSVVFHFWLIHYYKTTGEKRFIFGLIHFCIGLCGLSHNLIISKVAQYSIKLIIVWKTLQWVCANPPYRATPLLLVLICENAQNPVPLVFHAWLIHYYKITGEKKIQFGSNQCWCWCLWSFIFWLIHYYKPQERKRFIFWINQCWYWCLWSFIFDWFITTKPQERKDSLLD